MVLSLRSLVYRHAAGLPPVLDGIDLHLDAGEILCLLGPNGAGKSTLLRCLIGALKPETGTVALDGIGVAAHASARERARFMAYVPQATQDSALTLQEIALMGCSPRLPPLALPGHADLRVAHDALATVGLADLAHRPYHQASGGERQLALIARALVQQPRLLLMDEPTASLDLGNQARVLNIVRQLADDGLAVLMTTHQPEHALLLDANVVALAGGQVIAAGRAVDVIDSGLLSMLYRTPVQLVTREGRPVACLPVL